MEYGKKTVKHTHTHTSFVSLTANRCSSKIYGNKAGGNSRKARQLHLERMRFCHNLLEVLQFNQELARDLRKSQWCFNRVTFWSMASCQLTDLFFDSPEKIAEKNPLKIKKILRWMPNKRRLGR